MVRKKPTLFCLKRGELRQSWNKYNLYNLSRFRGTGLSEHANFFKQKWVAKAKTRKFHGEQVREKQWQRLFRSTPNSVVPMDPRYLAQSDGAIESSGRGSGRDLDPRAAVRSAPRTPYMMQTFSPLERRLDVAVHRALFASSVRQARQFCIHGFVRVNGKRMIYPGYALNPGDMFQVEPDRVLFATGAPKGSLERRETRKHKRILDPESEDGEAKSKVVEEVEALDTEPLPEDDAKKTLQSLMSKTKDLLEAEKTTASAKRKRDLREFQRLVRKTISKGSKGTSEAVDDQMEALMQKLSIQEEAEPEPGAIQAQPAQSDEDATRRLTPRQKKDLERVLAELAENPIDPSKPYATPWRPRDFMSAFAFIPRYLEVHHKVCSAVYLRHPVARPGLSEVPSPFDVNTNGLAFNWYLRRR